MGFPDFFEAAPVIHMHDPLAALLGAPRDGIIEYRYADAVRLAGHSCPTVASSFLMARAAVAELYPDTLAERGGISLHLYAPEDRGVTGVMAQVMGLITGAAASGGFPGIGGHHARKGLLSYAEEDQGDIHAAVQFQRQDTGAAVRVELNLAAVPPHPNLRQLMSAVMKGVADNHMHAAFVDAWQDRVRRLLLKHADDDNVIAVSRIQAPST